MAGTVESFDEEAFRTNLATALGVAPEAISLAVTAASVNVLATIAAADASDAASVLSSVQALASNAAVYHRRDDVSRSRLRSAEPRGPGRRD